MTIDSFLSATAGLFALVWPWVKLPLLTVALFHYTWVLFAAVMNAKRVRDAGNLSPQAHAMTVAALVIGYPLDLLFNLLFTIVLWELPKDLLLSGRLWRLSQGPAGWRQRRAEWWRSRFLDHFDPSGVHKG